MREYPQRETRGSDRSHVRMHPPDARASACDQCQREFPPGRMLVVIAPDSSFVHHDDPSLDGCRQVRGCSDHLAELIDKARAGWVEEQLWFGRLARASRQPEMRGASLGQLALRASLSPERLHQALRWNAWRAEPVRQLSGGQPLPVADIALHGNNPTAEAARHG
jgi:hypothetical protein